MTALLASLVACGFLWSLLLFFSAVFVRERRQEAGFGWALAGIALFFLTFSDRLPGHWTGPRELVGILPGVDPDDRYFSSSIAVLAVLFVVYVFRIAVFYKLFIEVHDNSEREDDEDVVNDFVAPVLSYWCFAICLVALAQPAYGLGPFATLGLSALLFGIYYGRLLAFAYELLSNLASLFVMGLTQLRLFIGKALLRAVQIIAVTEAKRRGGAEGRLTEWVDARVEQLSGEIDRAQADAGERIAQMAHRLRQGYGRNKRRDQ